MIFYRSARSGSDGLYHTAKADSEPLYKTATEKLESDEFTTATEELSPVPRSADNQLRFIVDEDDGYGRNDDLLVSRYWYNYNDTEALVLTAT